MNKYRINEKTIINANSIIEAVREYTETELNTVWCITIIKESNDSLPWYKNTDNEGKLIINNHGEIRKIQYISNMKVATKEQNLYDDAIYVDGWRLALDSEIPNDYNRNELNV